MKQSIGILNTATLDRRRSAGATAAPFSQQVVGCVRYLAEARPSEWLPTVPSRHGNERVGVAACLEQLQQPLSRAALAAVVVATRCFAPAAGPWLQTPGLQTV